MVPVTSNVSRLFPSEAYMTLLGERRKAMADQVTTASKQRLMSQVGTLSSRDMMEVERAIKVQLGMAGMI